MTGYSRAVAASRIDVLEARRLLADGRRSLVRALRRAEEVGAGEDVDRAVSASSARLVVAAGVADLTADDLALVQDAIGFADDLVSRAAEIVEGTIAADDRDSLRSFVDTALVQVRARENDRRTIAHIFIGAALLLRAGGPERLPTDAKDGDVAMQLYGIHSRKRFREGIVGAKALKMSEADCVAVVREALVLNFPKVASDFTDAKIVADLRRLTRDRARRGEPGKWEILADIVRMARLGRLDAESLRVEIQGHEGRRRRGEQQP